MDRVRRKATSVVRHMIGELRGVFPGALRVVGLPGGVYEKIDDWAADPARLPGENLVFIHPERITNIVPAKAQHLPGKVHAAFPGTITYIDLRTFVATMRDAKVVGRNGYIIASDNRVIGDVPVVYKVNYHPRVHPLLSLVKPPELEDLKGRSAALAIFSVNNYYHWLFEGLPRLELIRQAGIDWKSIDQFVVNKAKNQFVKPTLANFGIEEDRLRVTRDGAGFRCEELIVPSMPCRTDPSLWVCEWLRAHFLPKHTVPRQRLFVSRLPEGRRRVANEAAVEELLAARGFRKVYLEHCSFEEQVELFSGAEAVVAAHGAGMANLVFCQRGTPVIEMFNPEYVNGCYASIAQRVELNYAYLIGEGQFSGVVQNAGNCGDDISVNLDDLRQLLATLNL